MISECFTEFVIIALEAPNILLQSIWITRKWEVSEIFTSNIRVGGDYILLSVGFPILSEKHSK
jgi:hypothetical protein